MADATSTSLYGHHRAAARHIVAPLLVLFGCIYLHISCDQASPVTSTSTSCDIQDDLHEGARRDQIQALSDPEIVGVRSPEARALGENERVIGLLNTGAPLAVPHRVLYSHEVANLENWGGRAVTVTFCPLTSSSLAFMRDAVDGAEFGVSGLLYKNNLVMYDRTDSESLWPQMQGAAICGARRGKSLDRIPVIEMRWKRWKELYPSTQLVTEKQSGDSDAKGGRQLPIIGNNNFSEAQHTRTDKEDRAIPRGRVLGVPVSTRVGSPDSPGSGGGTAFPFQQLSGPEPYSVVNLTIEGKQSVILWDRSAQAAMAYRTASTFKIEDGRIVDVGSGSVWAVNGTAVEGPRFGDRLKPISEAFVAEAEAWHDFFPSSTFWSR